MNARRINSTEIKNLTKRRRDTDEVYTRRPDAELQIEKVLSLEKPQILAMLENRRRDDEAGYLLDETLCYLLREARLSDDNEMLDALYLELNRRVWKLLAKFRQGFINQADFEDFGQKIGLTMMQKIFDLETNAGDYAQVNFGDFVVTEAKVARRQNLVKVKRDREMFGNDNREDEDGRNDDALENISDSRELSAESKLIMSEGFGKLSSEQQIVAAMLLDGFQIESKDEREPTISRHLNVSSRTIRNWVKEIRAVLSDYQWEARRQ